MDDIQPIRFKFTHNVHEIRLSVEVDAEQIDLQIHDSGCGIQSADLPYVWDELYRTQNVKSIGGSGIGLALVRRIIQLHSGEVELEGEVNHGTTVHLYLPILTPSNLIPDSSKL